MTTFLEIFLPALRRAFGVRRLDAAFAQPENAESAVKPAHAKALCAENNGFQSALAALTLLVTLFSTCALHAEEPAPPALDLAAFAEIPVLEDGRKMPLDSYARNILLQFSGRKRFQKRPAIEWLARVLFTPSATLDDKIFLINNPEVADAIQVPEQEKRRYSYHDLQPGLSKLGELADKAMTLENNQRSIFEQEVVRVAFNLRAFINLVNLFEFSRPHSDFTVKDPGLKKKMGFKEDMLMFSYLDIFTHADVLPEVLDALQNKPPEEWNDEEIEAYRLSSNLYEWAQRFRGLNFGLIPVPAHGGTEETWVTPWDALAVGARDQALYDAIVNLHKMASAYLVRDTANFDKAVKDYTSFVLSRKGGDREVANRKSEVAYNRANLFFHAKWLYLLAFFISFGGVLGQRKGLMRTGLLLLVLAVVVHTAGLSWRVFLTARPPVTNLYGSFLFVGLVCVLLGLIAEAFQRNGLATMASSFVGLSLLMLAGRFAAEGDTMGKVVAVLDSNFWLSTHVIAITTGYAGVWLAGMIGHVYLIQRAIAPSAEARLKDTYQTMIGMLGFGLTFSFLGTMLGGVWADQSWGRFWGWDPKENGALLIVIWVSMQFHARMGRMVSERGMAACSVVGNVVVMMAWLGVNVMGVGLHSYGFTSGIAMGLVIYFAVEMLFLAVIYPVIFFREKTPAAAV